MSENPEDEEVVAPWIAELISEAVAPLKVEIERVREETAAIDARRRKHELHSVLETVGRRLNVEPAAMSDFCHRASELFVLDSGNLIAQSADGVPVFSSALPYTLLTIDEFANGLRESAGHLFRRDRRG